MTDLPHRPITALPLAVRINLASACSGRPLPGHEIMLWHCSGPHESRFTDDSGWAEFDTEFPVGVPGRWPHLHFHADERDGKLTLPRDACRCAYAGSGPTMADLAAACRDAGRLAMACVTGDRLRGFTATRTIVI